MKGGCGLVHVEDVEEHALRDGDEDQHGTDWRHVPQDFNQRPHEGGEEVEDPDEVEELVVHEQDLGNVDKSQVLLESGESCFIILHPSPLLHPHADSHAKECQDEGLHQHLKVIVPVREVAGASLQHLFVLSNRLEDEISGKKKAPQHVSEPVGSRVLTEDVSEGDYVHRDVAKDHERSEDSVDEVRPRDAPQVGDDLLQVLVGEEHDVVVCDESLQELQALLCLRHPADVHLLDDDLLWESTLFYLSLLNSFALGHYARSVRHAWLHFWHPCRIQLKKAFVQVGALLGQLVLTRCLGCVEDCRLLHLLGHLEEGGHVVFEARVEHEVLETGDQRVERLLDGNLREVVEHLVDQSIATHLQLGVNGILTVEDLDNDFV